MFSIGIEATIILGNGKGKKEAREGMGEEKRKGDLAATRSAYECERQRERKTKTGQLAQVTFDMSPAEKWSFFFSLLLRGTNDVLKNISA